MGKGLEICVASRLRVGDVLTRNKLDWKRATKWRHHPNDHLRLYYETVSLP